MDHLKGKIERAVFASIDELNEQLAGNQKLKKTPDTMLFGNAGQLDSLSFINLLVLVEENCSAACQVSLSLTNEFAAGTDDNAFRTVGSLITHMCEIVEGIILHRR